MQEALRRQGDKQLAIDIGEPLAFWPIEDLVAEKHRLTAVLTAVFTACPPDRSHDIVTLTSRREQVKGEIESLVYRYKRTRRPQAPRARHAQRDARRTEREQFQTDHA